MMPMLSFENVNVAIADVPVLRNLSFSLKAGTSAALIGRNGAGKTTTVRTIMGFTEARGTVRLSGVHAGLLCVVGGTAGHDWLLGVSEPRLPASAAAFLTSFPLQQIGGLACGDHHQELPQISRVRQLRESAVHGVAATGACPKCGRAGGVQW